MKETLDWIVEYMTENGLSDEEVQHFLYTKHKYLANKTVIQSLQESFAQEDKIKTFLITEYVKEYMLGI